MSAERAASLGFGADTSTRTVRPSRPISEPNSDWPARSIASEPAARSGTAFRSESANAVAAPMISRL